MKSSMIAFMALALITTNSFAREAQKVGAKVGNSTEIIAGKKAATQDVQDGGYAVDQAGNRLINWNKVKCKLDPNCRWLDAKF